MRARVRACVRLCVRVRASVGVCARACGWLYNVGIACLAFNDFNCEL